MPGSIRVLHVDDEPEFLDLTSTLLERENAQFSVETATSASEGLERLDDEVDCIVSDYEMPGQNGIEFLEAVREEYPDLPFVLFTGKGSEEVASDAISAGVTDYLQKKGGTEQYALLANRIENAVEAYRSQQALSERTRRLETLISNLPGMVYRCRNERGWPMENVEGDVEELTGYTAEELERNEVVWGEEILHPEDRDPMWEAVQEALDTGDSFEVTYRIVTRNGTTKWAWEQGRGVYDDGELEALEGFITDITERKEREKELERSRARLEALFERSPDMINVHDTDGNLVDPNPRLCEKTGYDEAELTDMKVWDLDRGTDPEQARALWESMDVGDRQKIEGVFRRRDGSTFPVEIHIRRLNLEGEDQFVAISRDISDRKDREQQLQLFQTIFETVDDAAFVVDGEWTVAHANEAALENVGLAPTDVIGQPLMPFVEEYAAPDEDPQRFERALEQAFGAETPLDDPDRLEFRLSVRGEEAVFEYQFSPIAEGGETERVAVIARDVTDRKRRERELERQNERLEEFASVVSHDLRNPLNVAQSRLELIRDDCEHEHFDALERAHDRMGDLIDDLMTLAREGEPLEERRQVALDDIVADCWETMATGDATLEVVDDRTVRANPGRLRQLFENLFRNALEHGGAGVTITVGATDGGFYVADDGRGIPADARADVFESGYSTSESGTGFGLAIVEEVAEAHGWEVSVAESSEGGARFDITGIEPVE